jgi:two-component system response regulator AtoC
MRILIVDDEPNLRKTLREYLALESIEAEEASNGLSAQKVLGESPFDAVVVDLKMPGMTGLELLEWLSTEGPAIPAVMMSAFGEVGDAVLAMKTGAVDYLVKPFDPAELVLRLRRAVREKPAAASRADTMGEDSPISVDPSMKDLLDLLAKTAPTEASVLITGESGTGKEVIARHLHGMSPRAAGPFTAINLGGIPETLAESELFGFERGAFTGADRRKIGLFETANGGTLFLDEIGEIPASLQVKLLRALQEKKIQRLGGIGVIPVDVRIIAATNRDIESMVKDGLFREDLYYRINVIRLAVPPLRDRPADISYLAGIFLQRLVDSGWSAAKVLPAAALRALTTYRFPGNVRELENMVERAVILADGGDLSPSNFGLNDGTDRVENAPFRGTLEEMEAAMIREALLRNEGHREKTAAELGITRRTLLNKMKSFGIEWDDQAEGGPASIA